MSCKCEYQTNYFDGEMCTRCREIERLRKENAVMRKALEYYSDDGVYSWAEFVFGDGTGSVDSEIMEDGGKRARAALAEISKP